MIPGALRSGGIHLWVFLLVFLCPFCYLAYENLTVSAFQLLNALFGCALFFGSQAGWGSVLNRRVFRVACLWLMALGLSSCYSVSPSASFPAFLKLLGLIAITAGIALTQPRENPEKTMFFSAGMALLFHGVSGVLEYWQGDPMPATWIDPAMRDIIKTRSAGIFGDPNLLGIYLAALLPFGLAGLFSTPARPAGIAFYGSALLFGGLGLFVSFSRGAYIAAIAGAAVIGLLFRPWRSLRKTGPEAAPRNVLLVVTAILAIVFFAGPFKYRFFSIVKPGDMTLSQRTLINKGLFNAFPHVPGFGFGLHSFNQVYPRFRIVGGDYPLYAHNEFLQTFLETGYPGTFGLIALSVLLFFRMLRMGATDAETPSWMNASGAGAFTALFIQNLSGFSARIYPFAALIALAAGCILYENFSETNPENEPVQPVTAKYLVVAFALLFGWLTLKNARTQALLEDVSQYLARNDLPKAELTLATLEESEPRLPLLHFYKAQIEERKGNGAGARTAMREAIRANPTEAVFWERLSVLSRPTNKTESHQAMEQAISLDPASERFRLEYARFLASEGLFQQALSQLDAALKTSPGFHEVYRGYLEIEALRKQILNSLPPDPMKK